MKLMFAAAALAALFAYPAFAQQAAQLPNNSPIRNLIAKGVVPFDPTCHPQGGFRDLFGNCFIPYDADDGFGSTDAGGPFVAEQAGTPIGEPGGDPGPGTPTTTGNPPGGDPRGGDPPGGDDPGEHGGHHGGHHGHHEHGHKDHHGHRDHGHRDHGHHDRGHNSHGHKDHHKGGGLQNSY